MVVRPYAVLALPAKDTVFGGLSEQGCRVELVAVPQRQDALGRCYAVQFCVTGITPSMAEGADARLREVFTRLSLSRIDPSRSTWSGAGWVPVQNVAIRLFRLMERPPPDMAAPWVVMQQGVAQLRLRPERGDMDGFLGALYECLLWHGISAEIGLCEVDDRPHQDLLAGLVRAGHPMEPLLA